MLHLVKNSHLISQKINSGFTTNGEFFSKNPLIAHDAQKKLRILSHDPFLLRPEFSNPRLIRSPKLRILCKSKHNGEKRKHKQQDIPSTQRVSERHGSTTTTLSLPSSKIQAFKTKNDRNVTYPDYESESSSDDSAPFSARSKLSINNRVLLTKFSEMKMKLDHLDFNPGVSRSFHFGVGSTSSSAQSPLVKKSKVERASVQTVAGKMNHVEQSEFSDSDADLSDDEMDLGLTTEPTWMKIAKEKRTTSMDEITKNDEYKMLAAVDMGTNSFHMVVVKADSQGRFQIEDVEKEDVRLGSGSSGFSVITPEAEERALAAIKRLKKIAKNRKAVMRVVATSAVREARNKRMFVRRVFETTGVEVEVLSGREEACLIYMGILQALPVYNKTVLTVDIGGGSTEFVVGRAGKPLFATSLKLGHIRLTERFIGDQPLQRSQIEDMRNHIRVMLADSGVLEVVQNSNFEMAIGSSGTIETILDMIHCAKSSLTHQNTENGSTSKSNEFKDGEFSVDELTNVVKKICKAKTVEMRTKLPGLPVKRADVIVGGAILLEEIFLAIGIKSMKVSPYALREGVIVDTLARTCDAYCPTPNLRRSSVLNLAKKFNTDRRLESAMHSAELAKKILSGLLTCKIGYDGCVSEVANLMDETDFEILESATVLHYIGMFISHKGYHKHSHYLIKNNEHLLGFSPMEIEMISLLIKYHRKKFPSSKDPDIAKLPEEMQKKLRALCAVIRVAVALDRCDSGSIANLTLAQDYDNCAIVVTPAIDPSNGMFRDVSLEIWSARAELEYFEKVFKKSASIVVGDVTDFDSFGIEPSHVLSS